MKMQAVSWDEVIDKVEGVFFDINFEQDFADVCIDETPIAKVSAEAVYKRICNLQDPYRYFSEESLALAAKTPRPYIEAEGISEETMRQRNKEYKRIRKENALR